jgi:hypothetical protein
MNLLLWNTRFIYEPGYNGADSRFHFRQANGRLAQLVEHIVYTDGVVGSSPTTPRFPQRYGG